MCIDHILLYWQHPTLINYLIFFRFMKMNLRVLEDCDCKLQKTQKAKKYHQKRDKTKQEQTWRKKICLGADDTGWSDEDKAEHRT